MLRAIRCERVFVFLEHAATDRICVTLRAHRVGSCRCCPRERMVGFDKVDSSGIQWLARACIRQGLLRDQLHPLRVVISYKATPMLRSIVDRTRRHDAVMGARWVPRCNLSAGIPFVEIGAGHATGGQTTIIGRCTPRPSCRDPWSNEKGGISCYESVHIN